MAVRLTVFRLFFPPLVMISSRGCLYSAAYSQRMTRAVDLPKHKQAIG